MKAEYTILSRAENEQAAAQMASRSADILLAESEKPLEAHLRACRFRHVRRLTGERAAPHFSAALNGEKVEVYILSVCNMAAAAALTPEQFRLCDCTQAANVYVVPCVVQRLSAERARCVAMPPVCVCRNGAWGGSAEALQYLPVACRLGTPAEMPCSAWLLKRFNLAREVANHGMPLYPVVQGLAHAGHVAAGVEIKGSGTESPLMLTIAEGRTDGRLQLSYADFYSADNAVNELVIATLPNDDEPPSLVRLLADDGMEYPANCAELLMFPSRMEVGMRFRWALSLLCNHYIPLKDDEAPREGADLCAVVRSSRRCTFCGLPLCHIVAEAGAQTVNVYAPVYDIYSPLPAEGERFCARGGMYAVPDEFIPTPEPVSQSEPEPELSPEPLAELLPVSAALAVAAGALLGQGYEWHAPYKPLFRAGVPDFRMKGPDGKLLMVLVDTVVNGVADKCGYACRYAQGAYPNHIGALAPDKQPSDLLFLTVDLKLQGGGFVVSVAQHGAVRPELKFSSHAEYKQVEPLSEVAAARSFGEMLVTHDFADFVPLLHDDVCYESDTAGVNLSSKFDLLRHLRACLDSWRQRDEMKNLRFLLSSVEWQGNRRPCTVACQNGEVISATIFDLRDNRVAAIHSLSGDVLDSLSKIDTPED